MIVNKTAVLHFLAVVLSASKLVAPVAAQTNLAVELATASSTEENTPACPDTTSCSPDKAIDGSSSTRWAGLKPQPPSSVEWFQLQLPSSNTIVKIELVWEGAYATEYDVQVSEDETTWNTVYTESSGNGGNDSIVLSSAVSGKYIKLNFYKRAQKRFGHSLWEVRVFGPQSQSTDAPSMSFAPSTSTAPTRDPLNIPAYQDPSVPVVDRVADLLGRMNLADKIGQMTQVERNSLNDIQDIADYGLGSLLSGGGSTPTPNTPAAWAEMVNEYQSVAMSTTLGIPLLYGVDAVHGHSNVIGATIFPHNIGLGATRNPTLIEDIGKITAKEVYATGIRWNFSPCLAVARDERWGRTYESFGEDPEIATMMTSYIDGLQGTYNGGPGLGAANTVLATPKHWVGDGGTTQGDDQGFVELPESILLDIHGTPYNNITGAIARFANSGGIGSIMPSYSSVNFTDGSESPGELKMHGHGHLINTVLRNDMGFEGFIISDWMAIDQLDGTYDSDVETAIKAGIDMVMVPHDYETFKSTLTTLYSDTRVPIGLIDQAVSRILTTKFHLGLFENPYAPDPEYLASVGSVAHRQVAREAVSQSLVLLKNGNIPGTTTPILPLDLTGVTEIVVAGKSVDDIGNQCGGWTITWQGGSGETTDGTSILAAIQAESPGVTITNKGDRATGNFAGDLGIVVVGETPYAEGSGDDLDLQLDQSDKAAIQNVCSKMPCVVILVSGRPLIINDQIAQADAFVAAWLPGSEGAGITDVLFKHSPQKDFTGTLPMTWASDMSQLPINVGDADYDLLGPLFPYGYGCNYTSSCPGPNVP